MAKLKNGLLFSGEIRNIWLSERRSIRIDGLATSLRLEVFYWDMLEKIADSNGVSLAALISSLFEGYKHTPSATTGFASFLRVCIGRYLELIVEQEVPGAARLAHRIVPPPIGG